MFTRLSKMSESTRFGSSEKLVGVLPEPVNSQECFSFSLPIPGADLVGFSSLVFSGVPGRRARASPRN